VIVPIGVAVGVRVGVLVGGGEPLSARNATTCPVQKPGAFEALAVCTPVGPARPSGLSANVSGLPLANCRRLVIPTGELNVTLLFHADHTPISQSLAVVVVRDGALAPELLVPVCAPLISIGLATSTPE
jgi:hypothetical protein